MASLANLHIHEYLDYYLGLSHSPGYATLISGPWGIGKTYLIKKYLKHRFGDTSTSYVYVSLFGLENTASIDDALVRAFYPVLGWKTTRIAGRVFGAILKSKNIDSPITADDIIDKYKADTYIFDDLERCGMSLDISLGYINEFVEHAGAKVIIVANEIEISDSDHYRKRKEKLIGKTLQVNSELDSALEYFLTTVKSNTARSYLRSRVPEISSIYAQSGLGNLRILQQTMWDFERFFKTLRPAHRQSKVAVDTLFRLLFSLSFEIKAGRLTDVDLRGRKNILVMKLLRRGAEDTMPSPLESAALRYPETEFHNDSLSDETLVDILVRGMVDQKAIKASLDASIWFSRRAEAAWRVVWHWFERSDLEVEAAVNLLEDDFRQRKIVITGELLHTFGLRLLLTNMGALQGSRADRVAEGKVYIDDLYSQGRLEVVEKEPGGFSRSAYGGLGIFEHQTPEFYELLDYLDKKQELVADSLLPNKAQHLMELMKSDVGAYYRELTVGTEFYYMPVLSAIDPDHFVSTLMSVPPAAQRFVFMSFKERYNQDKLDKELGREKPWINLVRHKLEAFAASSSPVAKYRVLQLIDDNLPKP